MIMNKYFKVFLFASLIGVVLAFLFFHDLENNLKSLTTENTVYLYQVGIFKEYNNALNTKEKYPGSII